ncbi:MAG: hypothetical protein AB1640_09940 [bacterium]
MERSNMATYHPYTTTVIGSHRVPRWYEALERQMEAGSVSRANMADAQLRTTRAAIVDQEIAGIDIITGGEMHRRTNNRHAPPNAMLNFFWEKTVAERIRAHRRLPPEQTLITSSCGMNHLPRHIAFAKLESMAEAKRMLDGNGNRK